MNVDIDELGSLLLSEDYSRGRARGDAERMSRLTVPNGEHAWDSSGRRDGCGHP